MRRDALVEHCRAEVLRAWDAALRDPRPGRGLEELRAALVAYEVAAEYARRREGTCST